MAIRASFVYGSSNGSQRSTASHILIFASRVYRMAMSRCFIAVGAQVGHEKKNIRIVDVKFSLLRCSSHVANRKSWTSDQGLEVQENNGLLWLSFPTRHLFRACLYACVRV